jgi:hypothetical protein
MIENSMALSTVDTQSRNQVHMVNLNGIFAFDVLVSSGSFSKMLEKLSKFLCQAQRCKSTGIYELTK